VKILVFIKEVPDCKVPLMLENYSGEIREDWSVPIMEPADASSLEAALKIKKEFAETRISLIHLGPVAGEKLIRRGLALGCDEGIRIWEEGLGKVHAQAKAVIFERVSRILGFDLILTGSESRDTGSGQIGALLASRLGTPYAGPVVACEAGTGKCALTTQLAGGYRERVESPFPMVAAMAPFAGIDREASLTSVGEAEEREIERYDLARIGLFDRLIRDADSALTFGPLMAPVSKLRFAEAPDSSLPSHLRIRKLVEGTVSTREGKVITGEGEDVGEALFETLRKEGWLNHLKRDSGTER
jgi:electron transfer flavoprotein beta subunit